MSFLDKLRVRRKKLADVLADEEYSGIRRIVEELYPDRAHFIYELLQNAEDASATEVSFILKENALTFEHNGRDFNEKDVEGITNIGKATKDDREDKIGRFGIGFKAVFAYSETPHIWSPTFSFKIEQLVLPSDIIPNPKLGPTTLFEFPFNNPKKPQDMAYAEIAEGLNELSEITLLFLKNIKAIGWKIGDCMSGAVIMVPHSEDHIEVIKQIANKATYSSHFLRFSTPIEIDGRPIQSVSLAYLLEFLPNVLNFDPDKTLSKQLKIVPANPGCVAVFFPAEKETSGLHFHLHAPFVPELSRASIKETTANETLFERLAELAASSMHRIRDLGLLTGEFLGVLPNPQDPLPGRYASIRQAIIAKMKSEPLTPTYSKSHAPALHLLQAKASLKELLSEKDIEFLIGYEDEPLKWAIGATQRNSNQDRFLAGLEIKQWDVDQFVEILSHKASEKKYPWEDEPDKEFMAWFTAKPVEWHLRMYTMLYNDMTSKSAYHRQQQLKRLHRLKIVRLGNGTYSTGDKCYFPSSNAEHDEFLPRVDRMVYQSGDKEMQKEDARKFLEEIGVREVGEADEVEGILKSRYRPERFSPKFEDFQRFIRLVEKRPDKATIFAEYFIIKRVDDKWGRPLQVFLDSPFYETGLSAYYDALNDDSGPRRLSDEYHNCGVEIEKLVKFSKAVGVIDKLQISKTNCWTNSQWDYLSSAPGQRGKQIDKDFTVNNLDKLFESTSIDLSKLIWCTLNTLKSDYLCATYQKSQKTGPRHADSQLVHMLRNAAWVPQENGNFVRPCDASRDQLPKGFSFDEGQEWLLKVGFGENVKKMGEEYKKRKEIASSLGIPVELSDYLSTLSDDERNKENEELKAYIKRKIEARRDTHGLQQEEDPYHEALRRAFTAFGQSTSNDNVGPGGSSTNPSRRRDKISEDILAAIENEAISGTHFSFTLRKKWRGKNDQVRGALAEWYGGQCQICGKTFKQQSGEPYFEGLYLVPYTTAEWLDRVGNVLCLCPWHSAMFQFGTKEVDEDIIQQVICLKVRAEGGEGRPTIHMKLCGEQIDIGFAEKHLIDLQEMIRASQSRKNNGREIVPDEKG